MLGVPATIRRRTFQPVREAEQRPRVGGAELEQQQAPLLRGGVGRRAVDRADVVDGDGAGLAGQRHGRRVVHLAPRRVHGAAEPALRVVVEDRAAVRAGDDQQRAVLLLHVVHHHADGGQVVVGVRVEGPVLVPLHRRPEAGRLHVELRRVEADVRPPKVLQHGHDLRVPHQPAVGLVVQVGRLDAPHARLGGRVAVLQVVHRVVRRKAARPLDEAVGDAPQLGHLLRGSARRDDDGADPLVFVLLRLRQHRGPSAQVR
jgi:hypothetical protein